MSRPIPKHLRRPLKPLKNDPVPLRLQGKLELLSHRVLSRQDDGVRFDELCDAYPQIEALRAWASTPAEAEDVEVLAYQSVPYRDVYLWTDHWYWKAEEAKYYAGHRCEARRDGARCTATKALDVHHQPRAEVGRERPEDLLVLCRPCHERRDPKRS